jgi:hypothetical protein
MFVLIELSLEQLLHLMGIGIKSQPPLVVRVHNPGLINARGLKPLTDRVNRLLGGSKHIMDFLCRPVLSILRRVWVRAMQRLVDGTANLRTSIHIHLHGHEKLLTLLQIVLAETNAHRQHGIALNALTLHPVNMLISLLVQNMLHGSRDGSRKSRDRQRNTDLTNQHLEIRMEKC